LPDRPSAVVIGAGIVGVSTALHLLMKGRSVVLVDRSDPGQETSYGNSGIIEASYVLPFSFPALSSFPRILANRDTSVLVHYPTLLATLPWMLDFYLQSRETKRVKNGRLLRPLLDGSVAEHRALMTTTDSERYFRSAGRIQIFRGADSFRGAALTRRTADELGVPYEVLNPSELNRIEPDVAPIFHKAIRWPTSARVTDPGAVTASYANRFVRDGGNIMRTNVVSLHSKDSQNWEIILDTGSIEAEQVVVCAGPWSPELLRPLGYRFPLGIKRGYSQQFFAVQNKRLHHAIADFDVGYLIVPLETGFRITTGVEYASLGTRSNPVQISRVLPRARELFPLGDHASDPWVGSRPCFADSLPVVGAAFKHKGLWLNFGHGHSGFTIGPSSGRLLAEMLCGERPFCDPEPYRAERFWDQSQ